MKNLIVFVFLMIASVTLQAEVFKAGQHYKQLSQQSTAVDGDVEVLEFFWYGCPHCYTFEPYIKSWKKTKPANVKFVRLPAIFRPDWEVQAKSYYALQLMGEIENIHGKIFEVINKDKKRLNTVELMADFVEKNGVNRQRFIKEYNSFAVDGMIRKVKKQQKVHQIQGVPSVVINGKYLISGSMAGSYDNMIKIMNYLIEKESMKN